MKRLAPILETPRLWLREMTEADARELVRMGQNPNILKFLPDPPLVDVDDAVRVLRTFIFPQYSRGIGRWAVVPKDTSELVGWCGLKHYDEPREIDLGYRFFEEHWGRGYATEAAQAVLQYGVERLPGERIVGKAAIGNTASRRVLEKIGLTFEGVVDEGWAQVAVYVWTG